MKKGFSFTVNALAFAAFLILGQILNIKVAAKNNAFIFFEYLSRPNNIIDQLFFEINPLINYYVF